MHRGAILLHPQLVEFSADLWPKLIFEELEVRVPVTVDPGAIQWMSTMPSTTAAQHMAFFPPCSLLSMVTLGFSGAQYLSFCLLGAECKKNHFPVPICPDDPIVEVFRLLKIPLAEMAPTSHVCVRQWHGDVGFV